MQVLMREEFSDLNLVVGRNLIAVHQLVLGAHSSQVALVLFTTISIWRKVVQPSGILSLSAPRRRRRTSQLQDYRVQEYRLPAPPSFKSNVLRESLSVDSQNIPCLTLKRRGSWVISVYL